jgi:hypothetical protein
MQNIDEKIERWKKRLLDLGKRNRLINFHETKRSNISILSPSYDDLYDRIVQKELRLAFPYPLKTTYDEDGNENNLLVQSGDIETNRTINEQQKTLKVLRGRANTSIEEQGVNVLYLTFGLIKWKEREDSEIILTSPLVLVPVTLIIESITDPYILQVHDDEIVVNPSLLFKFENDFGIILPEFDGHEDRIEDYISKVAKIAKKNNWDVTANVNLSLLSFLKINMYKDLKDNKDKIVSNPIIKALAGDFSEIERLPKELGNYDHDKNTRPIDTFQVVDADSSQQDAVLLSKKGVSFVLQGPPGTGKSQTITNIIAEAIADGKKVLFVSEKMAALEVVRKRLGQSGLEDFCLTLHSHKANKKDILAQLGKTLNIKKIKVQEEAIYKLSVLEDKRNVINEYHVQLHTPCLPLNQTIYEINGGIANLFTTEDLIFEIENVASTDTELLNKYRYLLNEFSKTIGKLSEDYIDNPWYGCNVPVVTHELRHDIEVNLNHLLPELKILASIFESVKKKYPIHVQSTLDNILQINEMLQIWSQSPIVPEKWLSDDIKRLSTNAKHYMELFDKHKKKKDELLSRYDADLFDLHAKGIISLLEINMKSVKAYLNENTYATIKDVVIYADNIIEKSSKIHHILKDVLEHSIRVSNVTGINIPNNFTSIE